MRWAIAAAALLLTSEPVLAQDCVDAAGRACPRPLDWDSPRGLALASGGRAGAASTSALMYNPAGLVLGGAYHVEGLGDYRTDTGTVGLGAAITDAATSKLAGGFGIRGFLSGRDGYKGIDGRLALALPLSDAVSLGVTGRYLNVDQEQVQADGSVRDQQVAEGITIDAGLRVQAGNMVQLGVAALNLVDLDTALVPITVAASAALMPMEGLSITGDLLIDLSTFESTAIGGGAGVEYLAMETFPLRLGYSVDGERGLHRFGFGLGYIDQMVGVEVGVRQDVSGGDDTRVLLGLRYHLR